MDSSKVIVLHFKTQVSTWFRTREPDLKTKKLDLWLRPWSLTPSCNLDLEPLGPCNSEPLKQSKSSRSQIFFETSSLKDFTRFTGKHLCWGLVLIKLQAFRPTTFLETPTQVFPVVIVKFLRTAFFIENLRWLLLTVLPQWSRVSWSVCSLISRLEVLSNLIKNLHTKRCTNNSLLRVTKQFLLCLNWFITCFRICFANTLVGFGFDEKLTQSVAQIAK